MFTERVNQKHIQVSKRESSTALKKANRELLSQKTPS